MEKIISRLLIESGYVKQDPTEDRFFDAYINHDLKDCIIVCEYDVKSLANFSEATKTHEVMQIFEEVRNKEDIFKSTSLVMPLKLNDFKDYEVIKNIILDVEENPYAFRKYVALYTTQGIKGINAQGDLKKSLEATLLDADRFKKFEEDQADEEFRTVLELFVKLPFMSVRGIPSIELEEYSSPLDKAENAPLRDIFIATERILNDTSLSEDQQIAELLNNELVQRFGSKGADNEA
jgi:hypothetical protein